LLAVVTDGVLIEFTVVRSGATAMARQNKVCTLMRIGAMNNIGEADVPAVEREKDVGFYVAVVVIIAFLVLAGGGAICRAGLAVAVGGAVGRTIRAVTVCNIQYM
jgi:hypothetical protein